MNLSYLKKEILPKRKQEIKAGLNLFTAQPIYVVYSLDEHICNGHDDFLFATNLKEKEKEYGYIDMGEYDEREFDQTANNMKEPIEVTRFWTDRAVAFFFTSGGAHAYLEYQKHNLTKGYVFVHYSGYANAEMDALLNGE